MKASVKGLKQPFLAVYFLKIDFQKFSVGDVVMFKVSKTLYWVEAS